MIAETIFIIAMIGLLYMMTTQRNRVLEERFRLAEMASKCPPHKWTYVAQPGSGEEFLMCANCKRFPGIGNEGEEV